MNRTVTIDPEWEDAINTEMERRNAELEAHNRQIEAAKEVAFATGREYHGAEPRELMTFVDVFKAQIAERRRQAVESRVARLSQELTATFMAGTPEERQRMMQDFAKYRIPGRPESPPT